MDHVPKLSIITNFIVVILEPVPMDESITKSIFTEIALFSERFLGFLAKPSWLWPSR